MAEHSFLWSYSKVCRLEYLRGEAPAVFIPALITATSLQGLFAPSVLEGVAVFAVLYLTGFIVNALADRELDLKYDTFKREIGEATREIGPPRVRGLLVVHLAIAFALTVHLSVTLGAPELLALVALGTFLAMAYSLPPLHFKVRGVAAHALSLSLSAFAIPFLFLYRVAAGEIDAYGWGICAAFTLTHYGLTYTNQAYDFDADLREGVRTPPVRLGLQRSLTASAGMVAVGLPLLTFALVALVLSRENVAAVWGAAGQALIAVGGGLLLAAGYSVPLRGISRMMAAVRAEPVESDAVPKMRAQVNYANFHAAGIASLAVFGLLLFASTVQAHTLLEESAAANMTIEGAAAASLSTIPGVGSYSNFTIEVRNAGSIPIPAAAWTIQTVSSETFGSRGIAGIVSSHSIHERVEPGETQSVSITGVLAFPGAGGWDVAFRLVLDLDGNGPGGHEIDRLTVHLP